MRHINRIILHCSATREGRDYSVDTIRGWHMRKGWRDIGYHYIVQRNGNIETGRPVEQQGAHSSKQNRGSIGICYIGGVEEKRGKNGKWIAKDTRTEEQKSSLHYFLCDLMEKYPDATLHGHNEFARKACPSFDVQEEYKDLIEYYARQRKEEN
jgi:N-acetylmuramoyl-L-alanine amidase